MPSSNPHTAGPRLPQVGLSQLGQGGGLQTWKRKIDRTVLQASARSLLVVLLLLLQPEYQVAWQTGATPSIQGATTNLFYSSVAFQHSLKASSSLLKS